MAEWAATTSIFTSPTAATEADKNCQNPQFGVLKANQTLQHPMTWLIKEG